MKYTVFHFTRWNKSHIHSKHLNILYLLVVIKSGIGTQSGWLAVKVVYSTDHSKAVVPVLVLLFITLWFILRGDLFYVLPCVILFLCFQSF